jgi:hypothetical protein
MFVEEKARRVAVDDMVKKILYFSVDKRALFHSSWLRVKIQIQRNCAIIVLVCIVWHTNAIFFTRHFQDGNI